MREEELEDIKQFKKTVVKTEAGTQPPLKITEPL